MNQVVGWMDVKINRCNWANGSELMKKYHDNEWGVAIYDDQKLFEMLILEGHQSGLSWAVILNRRELLREAYFNFDPYCLVNLTNKQLESYYTDDRVIKNKLKIKSVLDNAKAYFEVVNTYGSLSKYLWDYIGNKQIINHYVDESLIPPYSELSTALSKDLKRLGFKFVGPTIIYSFMQAVGMIDDHIDSCYKRSNK